MFAGWIRTDARHLGLLLLGIAVFVGGIVWIRLGLAGIEDGFTDSAAAFVIGVAVFLVTLGLSSSRESISKAELQRMLHDEGVISQLSLLESNIDAAYDRLNDFYNEFSVHSEFAQSVNILEVVFDHLDKVYGNLTDTDAKLNYSGISQQPRSILTFQEQGTVAQIRRNVREAIIRRVQLSEYLESQDSTLVSKGDDLGDLFLVMSSDLLKGARIIEYVNDISKPIGDNIVQLHYASRYLSASLARLDEYQAGYEALPDAKDLPKLFHVLNQDISEANDRLNDLVPRLESMHSS
ncbi:MAG: hypothetical protein ACE5Q6_14700 [Dehalococcoidia bacterium]